MASCQEDSIPTGEDSTSAPPIPEAKQDTSPAKPAPQENAFKPPEVKSALENKAIADDERKAAAKYGMMPKRTTNIAAKRLQGGGKQYFDSGDYMMGKVKPNSARMPPSAVSPDQPNPEILRNRASIAPISNRVITRLS